MEPVAILLSSKEDRDLLAGNRNGRNRNVVKPVNFAPFSDAVKRLGLFEKSYGVAPSRFRPSWASFILGSSERALR